MSKMNEVLAKTKEIDALTASIGVKTSEMGELGVQIVSRKHSATKEKGVAISCFR